MIESIKGLVAKYRRVIAFGLVGVMNTLVDYVVFVLLTVLSQLPVGVCQAIGYSAGIVNSFVMNKQIAFKKGTTTDLKTQIVRFIVVNGVSLLFSVLAIDWIVSLGVNEQLAKLPVTAATMVINYLGYKLFVFKIKS